MWGADRVRGELLKLDIRVSKRTIQRYLRQPRPPRPPGQAWLSFLRNHAGEIWACDFLPVTDLLFRPVYAFFVIALGTRLFWPFYSSVLTPTRSPTLMQLSRSLVAAER